MVTPPLVALHGFTQSPSAFSPLKLPLALAPFLSGHGPSPDLTSLSFEDEVTRLAALMRESLSGRPAHLLGYSQGARLALGLLVRHPELFAEATLVGLNPGLQTEEERQARLAWENEWIRVLETEGLAVFYQKWSSQALFVSQNALPPELRATQEAARAQHTAHGLIHALRTLSLGHMPNYWPLLAKLTVPTRLLAGASDEKFVKLAQAAEEASAHLVARSLPGAGHNPVLEAPEAVRREVLRSQDPQEVQRL